MADVDVFAYIRHVCTMHIYIWHPPKKKCHQINGAKKKHKTLEKHSSSSPNQGHWGYCVYIYMHICIYAIKSYLKKKPARACVCPPHRRKTLGRPMLRFGCPDHFAREKLGSKSLVEWPHVLHPVTHAGPGSLARSSSNLVWSTLQSEHVKAITWQSILEWPLPRTLTYPKRGGATR